MAMSKKKNEINTEADAMRDILAWSDDRPIWQRDALRRITVNGELNDADIDDLTKLCKNSSLPNEPFAHQHFNAQQTGAPTVALRNIRSVQNVNALAENQTLNLIPKGVSIIYGDNGAGKSGYVRILKRACRARAVRGKEDRILPNIHQHPSGQQRAELEYQAGAQTQKTEWKVDEPVDDLLSEISVFDSRTANVHVEETNDLAYTPYPMKLLENLVAACKSVKHKIDGEIATIKVQTPQSILNPSCSSETAVGKLIKSLNKDTTPKSVNDLAALGKTDVARLKELAADFAQDPKLVAKRLTIQKKRLEGLLSKLTSLNDAVSSDSVNSLKQLAADLKTKRAAAYLASQKLSADEPIDGIGSDAWRELWESARAFSTSEAYSFDAFPVVGEDARCVLCHQELSDDASRRLERFEAFVQDRTQQEQVIAYRLLSDFRSKLTNSNIAQKNLFEDEVFIRNEQENDGLADAVRNFSIRAKWRLRAILRKNGDSDHDILSIDETGLQTSIDDLDKRIKTILANDDSDERNELRSELSELNDRQWLSGIKDDILAEIERRKSISELELALKDTNQNTITRKNTSLSQALITDRLRARFVKEINHLELSGLAIELAQAGSKDGISRFKVSLVEGKTGNTGEVLSEGEYRCVALAGFMAELATSNSNSGIIFDDPVSSLDHLHREAIAKRLAQEGRHRQVIVFTHDLPFLFLLRNACTQGGDPALKTDVALRHIQKRQNVPGYCRNEPPDKAQNASSRLNSIRRHLANSQTLFDQDPDSSDWLMTARGLIDSLRQTWEAAVEDAVSPVLQTFSSKVNTKGFSKLSAITEADATTMRQHYGQCSNLLHKISDAMNPSAPTPTIIEQELNALEKWLRDVSDRQKQIKAA